ncbi:hypothetical protein HRG_004182 [Hirsutella rhossiliensis]|uniref:Uncharacterized protein n=1 Tax=Hirsutella rhossiliensis TaxID=111463 RepID=A0A9P8SJ14_9HYPO|nr:uncharacterized protein HRG_04182 [Hirsutella rhossiliensis]KAH0963754.1 hypothetical protein HRG_04182 [Hirsutella rhossiliensis]
MDLHLDESGLILCARLLNYDKEWVDATFDLSTIYAGKKGELKYETPYDPGPEDFEDEDARSHDGHLLAAIVKENPQVTPKAEHSSSVWDFDSSPFHCQTVAVAAALVPAVFAEPEIFYSLSNPSTVTTDTFRSSKHAWTATTQTSTHDTRSSQAPTKTGSRSRTPGWPPSSKHNSPGRPIAGSSTRGSISATSSTITSCPSNATNCDSGTVTADDVAKATAKVLDVGTSINVEIRCYGNFCAPVLPCDNCGYFRVFCKNKDCYVERCSIEERNTLILWSHAEGKFCYAPDTQAESNEWISCVEGKCTFRLCGGDECNKNLLYHGETCIWQESRDESYNQKMHNGKLCKPRPDRKELPPQPHWGGHYKNDSIVDPQPLLQHWLYSSDVDDAALAILDRPDLEGVQALYRWRDLESEKAKYDFSKIIEDLKRVQAKGKKLWVQLQDRTFFIKNIPTPKYMQTPLYSNGSVPTCDGENCERNFEHGGWMAAQWNPHVRERFQALMKAMADELDGQIYGLNLPETSIEVEQGKNNYTSEGYFQGELENAAYAASVFEKSYVVQYVNFWPDGWENNNNYFTKSFSFYAKHGVGVGGPDLIPYDKGQEKNSYPFLREYRDKVPISVVAVQEPDLKKIYNETGKPFTKEEFVDYATKRLGVRIIFWATASPWLNGTRKA